MDKATVIALRTALNAAVAQVEKDMGVSVTFGNARFGDEVCNFKVAVVENSASGTKVSPAEADFRKNHRKWGLKETDLGRTFFFGGNTFTLVGSKSSRYKYPLLGKDGNGNTFKFPADRKILFV